MKAERWEQVESLFFAALEREERERDVFLASSCADDSSLRREVESLLASHKEADRFIEAPAFIFAGDLLTENQNVDAIGRVGPYKILKEINHGGMGAVYLAQRDDDQYKKQVAIKLIKRGLEMEEIRRRFRHERQILASLDHPNIAKLLDGSTTEEGLPYFVMDYIEGLPINQYCDAHGLSIAERLALFRTVCSAVAYAHQHLVIHRDLKPSNILVTDEDVPKLLDFGIAKLLDVEQSKDDNHTVTQLGAMTPDYASPEQIKGESVTIVSDVYSLGVLLYELLTGTRPYKLNNRRPDEAARIICETEPDKPSAVGKKNQEGKKRSGGVREKRSASLNVSPPPHTLSPFLSFSPSALRGDLDNIVLMALRKEPERRYSSVDQFSEDIRRYLEGLPVIAHKDTFAYRASKFIKRHKAGAAAVALVALSLIAGFFTTAWQARVAARQAAVAEQQRDKARLETLKAERINTFLQNMLVSADPNWYVSSQHKGRDVKVVETLDEAAKRIDAELSDQLEVCAELHHTIGNTYRALGFYDKAEKEFRAALDGYRRIYGERHPKVAENLYFLAATLTNKNLINEEVETLYRQAIEMMRATDANNANLPYMLQDLGGLLTTKGKATEAEPVLRESLELFRKRYGEDHISIASDYERLGRMYENRGDIDQAQAMYREAVARYQRLPDQTSSLNAPICAAQAAILKGDYAEAEIALNKALNLMRQTLGESHPQVANLLEMLAYTHSRRHDYLQATAEIERSLEIVRRAYPSDHPLVVHRLSFLSLLLLKDKQFARAQAPLRKALALYKAMSAQGNREPLAAGYLGESLVILHRYNEAEPLLNASYEGLRFFYSDQHPHTIEARQRLANLYAAWNKPNKAMK